MKWSGAPGNFVSLSRINIYRSVRRRKAFSWYCNSMERRYGTTNNPPRGIHTRSVEDSAGVSEQAQMLDPV